MDRVILEDGIDIVDCDRNVIKNENKTLEEYKHFWTKPDLN